MSKRGIAEITAATTSATFGEWLNDRKNRRMIPHRMEDAGYSPFRNDGTKDGFFKINGHRTVIYALAGLSKRDRHIAVGAPISNSIAGREGREGRDFVSPSTRLTSIKNKPYTIHEGRTRARGNGHFNGDGKPRPSRPSRPSGRRDERCGRAATFSETWAVFAAWSETRG
jgi:hypothetical protein